MDGRTGPRSARLARHDTQHELSAYTRDTAAVPHHQNGPASLLSHPRLSRIGNTHSHDLRPSCSAGGSAVGRQTPIWRSHKTFEQSESRLRGLGIYLGLQRHLTREAEKTPPQRDCWVPKTEAPLLRASFNMLKVLLLYHPRAVLAGVRWCIARCPEEKLVGGQNCGTLPKVVT